MARHTPDYRVEVSLYRRAIGYEYEEVTKELAIDAVMKRLGANVASVKREDLEKIFGNTLVVTKVVNRHVAPNVTAQIFWLKNRKPKLWRDKQDVDHSGEQKHVFVIQGLYGQPDSVPLPAGVVLVKAAQGK